jgi:hypothetical protein
MGTERFFYLVVLNLNDGNLLFSTSRKGWVAFGKIKCCEDLSGILNLFAGKMPSSVPFSDGRQY